MIHTPSRPGWHPSRGAAFAVHLILSLLIFSTLVVMMLLYWFPGELFFLDGGWQGLKLVAMIDLVLGPALTLILFKPGKPGLVLDMTFIALLQIAALGYGFYTTWQQRTVAIVYAEQGFKTLSARDKRLADEELRALSAQPQALPPAAMLDLPLMLTPAPSKETYGKYLEEILNGYPGPDQRSDLFVPLGEHHASMQADALDPQELADLGALPTIEKAMKKVPLQAAESVEFYRFKARYASGIAIFDPQSMRIIDYVPKPTDASAASGGQAQVKQSQAKEAQVKQLQARHEEPTDLARSAAATDH